MKYYATVKQKKTRSPYIKLEQCSLQIVKKKCKLTRIPYSFMHTYTIQSEYISDFAEYSTVNYAY